MKKFKAKTKNKKGLFTRALLSFLYYYDFPDEDHAEVKYVSALITAGATIHSRDCNGDTPLRLACNSVPIIQLLVAAGAHVDDRNNGGDTALICAARNGSREGIKALIDKKANVNIRNQRGNNALMCVISFCSDKDAIYHLDWYVTIVKALIKAGTHINKQSNKGTSALMLAASKSHRLPMVQALLAAGANQNLKDKAGKRAIDYAATEEIKALLLGN